MSRRKLEPLTSETFANALAAEHTSTTCTSMNSYTWCFLPAALHTHGKCPVWPRGARKDRKANGPMVLSYHHQADARGHYVWELILPTKGTNGIVNAIHALQGTNDAGAEIRNLPQIPAVIYRIGQWSREEIATYFNVEAP